MNKQIPFKQLITFCKKGKNKAQEELYHRYFSYGITVALHYTSNREEAEEVLNDAYVKVFRNIKKYNSNYPFKTWFRKIIINTAINYHKKYHDLEIEGNIIPITESTTTFNKGEEQLTIDDVMKIVQQLTPAYQLVFMLSAVEGYKHQEIAKMLNISIGTSKSNLSKARVKLQKIAGIYYPDILEKTR